MTEIKFIDLFAGIGGFHLALHRIGAKCVFACEIDPYARKTYTANFRSISPELFQNNLFTTDITKINSNDIPDFDILCAGFPCQPFSEAGLKLGFKDNIDSRGNMFFEILRIIEAKRPRAFFLENVRGLLNHDSGNTLKTIREAIEKSGYSFHYKIVKASDFGLPQHRPRIFIIGFKGETTKNSTFKFPEKIPLKLTMSDIFGGACNKDIGYTIRVGGKSSGLYDRRNWDTYLIDGIEKKLTHVEAKKMMGFPDKFVFPVSETQSMKQLGNSVAVNAIKATASNILSYLRFID